MEIYGLLRPGLGFKMCLSEWGKFTIIFFFFFFFAFFGLLLLLMGAAPVAHGGCQARGLMGAVTAGLHQSHSNAGSKSHLRPTPQLTATPDP